MSIFTIRQKQSMLLAAIPIIVALAAFAAAIEYWYITLPVALILAAIIYLLVRRASAKNRHAADERAQRLAAAQQALYDAQLDLARALIARDGPNPLKLAIDMSITRAEAAALIAAAEGPASPDRAPTRRTPQPPRT